MLLQKEILKNLLNSGFKKCIITHTLFPALLMTRLIRLSAEKDIMIPDSLYKKVIYHNTSLLRVDIYFVQMMSFKPR
jgi:hypothetical protein